MKKKRTLVAVIVTLLSVSVLLIVYWQSFAGSDKSGTSWTSSGEKSTTANSQNTGKTDITCARTSENQDVEKALALADAKIWSPIPGPPFTLVNECLSGTVVDECGQLGQESSDPLGLVRAIDGDLSTSVTKAFGRPGWLEVSFGDAPRWINRIKVAQGGTGPFRVEYKDVRGFWHVVGTHIERHPSGEPVHYDHFDFEPVRAMSIRWRASENDIAESGEHEIYELEAYFTQADDDGLWEIGVEWCNIYRTCPAGRLRRCDNDARSLYRRVGRQPGWVRSFEWGNAVAWEEDFKRAALGGTEQFWIDRVDLAYYSGHGSRTWDQTWGSWRRSLYFGYDNLPWRVDDCHLVPGDGGIWWQGTNSWGNEDLEWIGFSACNTMRDHRHWANCMDNLHLILGWETVMNDVNFGRHWARQMIRGRTITRAWFSAADRTHGNFLCFWPFCPTTYITGVVAEELDNYRDHLWGKGYVSPDYPADPWYWYWRHRTRGWRGMGKSEIAAHLSNSPSDPFFLLPSRTENGIPVKYKKSLLSAVRESTMVMYEVTPRVADELYTVDVCTRMCPVALCCIEDPIQVERDDYGQLWAVCGSQEFQVSEASGGVQYIDSEWWMSPPLEPPTLPSEDSAIQSAEAFLDGIGFLPGDAYRHIVRYSELQKIDKETGNVDPGSSRVVAIEVCFRREMDNGYRVVGPGAVLNVTYGDEGRLERFSHGGWRDVRSSEEVFVITLQQATELIATSGSDATTEGIPNCDTLIVIDAVLAYYEDGCDEDIDFLEPIWVLASSCISENDTFEAEIYVPARFLPPQGFINDPPDGSEFMEGETVTFTGSATGGTPPYTFDWSSDMDSSLGTGATISTDTLSAVVRDSISIPHTITLTVTDANGMTDDVNISVVVTSYECEGLRGDPTGDGAINVLDVLAVVNHILGIQILTGDALCRADCHIDHVINILDALAIVRIILGEIPNCEEAPSCADFTPGVQHFLESSFKPYLSDKDFARFMALVKAEVGVPTDYKLNQNYPNPFNPVTSIEYSLPEAAKVKVEVYNLLGQVIKVLVDSDQEAGYYHVQWDASDVASGVYFYKLSVDGSKDSGLFRTGQWSATKRMVLMR